MKDDLRCAILDSAGSSWILAVRTGHRTSQSQYSRWRARLPAGGPKVFDRGGPDLADVRLQKEVRRLKGIIVDLTVEVEEKATAGNQAAGGPAGKDQEK